MDVFRFALVVVSVSLLFATDVHAQLKPGDTCILSKSVKAHTKPKGKGKAVTLEPGTEVLVEQLRGKGMKIIAKGATLWLKRGKLRNRCGGAEMVEDPVFEPDAGFGTSTETIEATETAAESPEPAEEPVVLVEDDDDAPLEEIEEAEPMEPVDDTDISSAGGGFGGDVDLEFSAGLGAGGQGGATRLTFDLALGFSWRFFDALAVGARLFLHGTPGVGYGFGGLTAELRYYLPSFGSIEPYAQAGVGGGYGAAGELTPVFAARLGGGGRMFVLDRLFVGAEVVVVISQLSAAGLLDVGVGWSF